MPESLNIASASPNKQHAAQFICSGEIRFGPLYFSLSVDEYSFGQRIFGDVHRWSSSSNMLAAQEWLTLDYSEGPITALVLIDLHLGRESRVLQATKRFIVPVAFEDPIVVYRIDYGGNEGLQHFDLDTSKITEWNTLA
jgi:hypothetical protein